MSADQDMIRVIRRRELWRTLMYLGLSASGLFVTADPSQVVIDQVPVMWAYFWSISMVLSSLACAYGSATGKWFPEYSGLPMMCAVLEFYGFSAILGYKQGGYLVIGFGFIMLAFAAGLIGRWFEVKSVKNISAESCREEGA